MMRTDGFLRCQWLGPACVALVAMAGVNAQAAPTDVYQGTLGGAAVVLEFSETGSEGQPGGRYFYRRHGVDIPLRGRPDGLQEALPLASLAGSADGFERGPVFEDPQTQAAAVVWEGRLSAEGYEGQWRDARSGRRLPFSLRRVASYDPEALLPGSVQAVTQTIAPGAGSGVAAGSQISMQMAPFDFLRLNVATTPGPEVVRGAVGYRKVVDPRTKLGYPRLTRHPDAAMMRRVNAHLQQRHWALNLDALACAATAYTSRGPAAGSLGDLDSEQVEVAYLSVTLMSVVEAGSTYCGGAHPNNHYEPYTLDLLRGESFDFSRILKGYQPGEYTPVYDEAFMQFVREAVARSERPGAEPAAVTDDSSADLACSSIWPQHLYLHFEQPDQLAFVVSGVGHAMGACLGPHLTLPFARLQPLLKPGAERYLKPPQKARQHP